MSKEIELNSECFLSDAELLAVLDRESAKSDSGYNTLDAMQWAQQALLEKAALTKSTEKEPSSPNEVVSEHWKTLVYELCNVEMMRRKRLSKSMAECMGKATGNRGKYPDPLEALAKLALSQ